MDRVRSNPVSTPAPGRCWEPSRPASSGVSRQESHSATTLSSGDVALSSSSRRIPACSALAVEFGLPLKTTSYNPDRATAKIGAYRIPDGLVAWDLHGAGRPGLQLDSHQELHRGPLGHHRHQLRPHQAFQTRVSPPRDHRQHRRRIPDGHLRWLDPCRPLGTRDALLRQRALKRRRGETAGSGGVRRAVISHRADRERRRALALSGEIAAG